MRQIITHFTDNDAYTFSCMYYVLQTYPRAEVKYSFFDRNNAVYPNGFADLLQEQVNGMANVIITEEEVAFMERTMYYLPKWFFTFLKGYRFNPSEVTISQTDDGHLHIGIQGKWYSTIMWEMPILSTISELMHEINGDMKKIDMEAIYRNAVGKGLKAISNGLLLSDMGTRRRFSFDVQSKVIDGLKYAQTEVDCGNHPYTVGLGKECRGKFVGTSNVYFAMKYDLVPIGTMSHQIISAEECVSGVFECNYNVMDKWSRVFDGDVGTYLYDCFGDKVFFNNLSRRLAKTFDGLRVDSGDEREQTEKIIDKYKSLGINPSTKSVVYSNALTIDKAIDLHKWIGGRVKDAYGIGTHLCADVRNSETNESFPYSNIVIKLVGMRITETREWHDCVKLSCDRGKTLGNQQKCAFLLKEIS